jgi:predicted GNAT family N-acyltransferase
MSYATTLLSASHEKAQFSCGKAKLDEYIRKQAKQDMKGKVAACFVLSDDNKAIKGYYTLSNGSVPRSKIPEDFIKNLPKYKELPVTLLGRLAVNNIFQGQKLGSLLLLDALKRSLDTALNSIASMAVIVDPIDEQAIDFYTKYGFIMLPDSKRMFLPMGTIEKLFR